MPRKNENNQLNTKIVVYSEYFPWYFSDDDCGNPMVAGYQADVDPDDFTPDIDRIKVINT